MEKLYVYNSWHNGDVITNRCLLQKLISLGIDKSKILLASYQNRHYLVALVSDQNFFSCYHPTL
jgi:hypothetical protein